MAVGREVQDAAGHVSGTLARRGVLGLMKLGSWAVLDQALFALANFGLNVLLARWLSAAEYGAFSVVFAGFLLVGALHTALLSEPMLVFGHSKFKEDPAAYFRVLLRGHWVFCGIASAVFSAVAVMLGGFNDGLIPSAMLAMAIAGPLVLFQWLARRACYLVMRPGLAAGAGALYMGAIAAGTTALSAYGNLSSVTGLLVMAAASSVSGAWITHRLGVGGTSSLREQLPHLALEAHWEYGRWAVAAAGLSWATGNILTVILPVFVDLDAVGALRAAFNVVVPVMQVFAALGSVVVPLLVRANSSGELGTVVRRVLAVYVGIAAAYGLVIFTFSAPLTSVIYGASSQEVIAYLNVFAVMPIVSALVSVAGGALRALEMPRSIFVAYCASAVVSVSVGTWLTYTFGAHGAVTGMVLSTAVTGGVLARDLLHALRRSGRRS